MHWFAGGRWAADPDPFYLLFVFICVYLAGTALDILRRRYVESFWVRSKAFAVIAKKIDGVYETAGF